MMTKLTSTLDELLEYAKELSEEVEDEEPSRYQLFILVASHLKELLH